MEREKTFLWAELTLAIEELRSRHPDLPWLIPVRFDNCDVPDYDIGRGRTLSSIQRADLFGGHRAANLERLVTVVQRVVQKKPGPVAVPRPAAAHESVTAVRRDTRETDPARRPPSSRENPIAIAAGLSVAQAMLGNLITLPAGERLARLPAIGQKRPVEEIAALIAGLHRASAHADADELRRVVGLRPVSDLITLAAELRDTPGCERDAGEILGELANRDPATALAALREQERNAEARQVVRLVAGRPVAEVLTIVELLRRNPKCADDHGRLLSALATRPAAETAASIAALRARLRHQEADKILKIAARRPAIQVNELITALQLASRQSDAEQLTLLTARR